MDTGDTLVDNDVPSNLPATRSVGSFPDDNLVSEHKSRMAQMGDGDPQGPLRDVDDVYIGKCDADLSEFVEVINKTLPKDEKSRALFPGYDGSVILPSRTRLQGGFHKKRHNFVYFHKR